MPLDSTIPLQSVMPDPMASLSSLLDVRTKSLTLQKSRQTFDADVAKAKAESSTQQSAAAVNSASIQAKINQIRAESSTQQSGATVASANVNPLIQQQAAQTSTAQTGANKAEFDLKQHKLAAARQGMMEITQNENINNTDPKTYNYDKAVNDIANVRHFMIANGHDRTGIESITARLISAAKEPGGVASFLKGQIIAGTPPSATASTLNTNAAQTDDGANVQTNNMNRYGPGGAGAPVMAPIRKELPPTTTIVGRDGTKGYKGPADNRQSPYETHGGNDEVGRAAGDVAGLRRELSARNLTDVQREILGGELTKAENTLREVTQQAANKPTSGFVRSELPPGQLDSVNSTQKGVNDHYRGLQDKAENAAQDIGVLQNIISHAHGASTGIGSDKLAMTQAILGKLGIDSAKASTLDYDLLGKNAAMIQLAGGDTNLAKTLAGAANPNSHMSEEAIRQAAHQIIGQKKMALQGLKMFTPLKALSDGGHMEAYNSMMPKYLEAADPRIMQLPNMSEAEKTKMKNAMSPTEQKAFSAKIRALKTFGIEP